MLCSPQARVWDVEVGPEGGEGVTGRRRTLTAPHASSLESRGTSLQRWRGSPAACSCPVPGPLSFDSPALHPASWTARGLARGGREGGPAREGVKERRKTEKSSWNSSPGVWPRRRPKPGETFRLPRCTPSQLPLQSVGHKDLAHWWQLPIESTTDVLAAWRPTLGEEMCFHAARSPWPE